MRVADNQATKGKGPAGRRAFSISFKWGGDHRARQRLRLSSVPASTAVPAAAQQHDDENDDENCGEIHLSFLKEMRFEIPAIRGMHSSTHQRLRLPLRSVGRR